MEEKKGKQVMIPSVGSGCSREVLIYCYVGLAWGLIWRKIELTDCGAFDFDLVDGHDTTETSSSDSTSPYSAVGKIL
eukprot:10694860-Ditylum_brightwellii.AAC.1